MQTLPDLKNIKLKRKALGITQKELAKRANISQSTIAKVEQNKINVSYDIAKRILETLMNIENKSGKRCKQIMTKKVITISKDKKVKDAVKLMKKYSISQLPVIDNFIIGSISEDTILEYIEKKENILDKTIEEVMSVPFPFVSPNDSVESIVPLVKRYNAVIVVEGKEVKGIITKTNMINS